MNMKIINIDRSFDSVKPIFEEIHSSAYKAALVSINNKGNVGEGQDGRHLVPKELAEEGGGQDNLPYLTLSATSQ